MMILRKYRWCAYFVLLLLFLQLLSYFPLFVENYYSTQFYPLFSQWLRFLLGWIPFSTGDILYGIAILFLIKWLFKFIKNWKTKKVILVNQIFKALFWSYFIFNIFWGFNYYRLPLFEKLDLNQDYTEDELRLFTEKILQKTNEVQFDITKDAAAKVENPYSLEEIYVKAKLGFRNLNKIHPEFEHLTLSTKSSLISTPLSYMGFGGYLNPFTNEAQVNYLLPRYQIGMTTTHEMAHQIGIASESEANFVGFLAVIHHDDLYFQYSGYSYALRYCLSIWAEKDEAIFEELKSKLNPGILENYKENKAFQEKYESFVEDIFKNFYNNFLKINQQEDGLIGYSKFINLLISYSQKNQDLFL